MRSQTVEREYDVRDLLAPGLKPPGGKPEAALADEYGTLIVETVDPDSWAANRGTPGTIRYEDGKFVVTQTKANHKMIEGLLEQLRESRRPQDARRVAPGVGGPGL
jgi:hypothetical protein